MLAPFCPTHRSRVLLPTSRILAVFNTTTGIHVAYRCWCDDVGIWTPGPAPGRSQPDPATVRSSIGGIGPSAELAPAG